MVKYSDDNYAQLLIVKDENGNAMPVKCDATGAIYIIGVGGSLSAPVVPNKVSDDNYVLVSDFKDETTGLPEYIRASATGALYVTT